MQQVTQEEGNQGHRTPPEVLLLLPLPTGSTLEGKMEPDLGAYTLLRTMYYQHLPRKDTV